MRLPYVATAASAVALVLAVGAPNADASSAVRFGKIQYNSPGSDTGSNSSLNAEYVTVTNHAATKRKLTGWTLRDASHHVFHFPTFSLASGASVRVHTGKGSNGAHDVTRNATRMRHLRHHLTLRDRDRIRDSRRDGDQEPRSAARLAGR